MKTVATVRTIRTPIAQYNTYNCWYQKSGSSVEDGGMDVPDERMSHRTALETPEMHCVHFLPLHFQPVLCCGPGPSLSAVVNGFPCDRLK